MRSEADASPDAVLIGGREERAIVIVDYDPSWPERLEALALEDESAYIPPLEEAGLNLRVREADTKKFSQILAHAKVWRAHHVASNRV